VLLRHAQSQWNLENRFTGWADVGLTEARRSEARRAGALLRAHDYRFDCAFTSQLRRATETLEIVLRELGQEDIPVERSWRLNEAPFRVARRPRQGGVCRQARRGDTSSHAAWLPRPAAPLAPDDPRYRRHREAYPDLDPVLLPATESLADTLARLLPYWNGTMMPAMARGERCSNTSRT
jgi:2,3-bisphosphoglycerate-dependent phosphoglycerate mutase